MNKLTVAIYLLLFFLSNSVLAFKGQTHVWVGQQVLNDVIPDSRVSIPPYGEFTVNPDIVAALRDYPRVYLMGNVGPDGFPDVIGGQVTTHAGMENGWSSDDWLKWMLSGAETARQKAFAYGYLSHAAADVFAHTYVNTYTGDIFNVNDNEIEVEQRHIYLESYIANLTPPLMNNNGALMGDYYENLALGDELPVEFIRNKLITNQNANNQYRNSSATLHLKAMYEYLITLDSIIARVDSNRNELDRLASETLDLYNSYYAQMLQMISDGVHQVCSEVRVDRWCGVLFPFWCGSYELVCRYTDDFIEIQNYVNIYQNQYARITNSINPKTEALYFILVEWRSSVNAAINEYVKSSSHIVVEIMREDGDPISVVEDWLSCHGKAFLGVPSVISNADCAISNYYADIMSRIDDLQSEILLLANPLLWQFNEFNNIQDDIQNELVERLAEYILQEVASPEVRNLITVWSDSVDGSILNYTFGHDSSSKGLLEINNIASRVNAEMYMQNGHFDPDRYAVIYNAVVLAKLSLLDSSQLNKLAAMENLFLPESNVLFDAFLSIDGNHQWMGLAPPAPRRSNYVDQLWPSQRVYGFSVDRNLGGFKLWQDKTLRDTVFSKIFRGPLVPGIEKPVLLGLSSVLENNYPYQPCNSFPFPPLDDSSCTLEFLIPIFHMLH